MPEADGVIISGRDRAILRRVLAPFADRIERVGVFGSRASGSAHSASDIDLVIWGDLDDDVLARIWSLFDRSGLAVTVDVVLYRPDLPPPLRRRIDRVAKPLFTRDELGRDLVDGST